MVRAYDDWGNVVDMVEYDKQIRADAIVEFLSFCKEHADEYDMDKGWSLEELIDMNIRFEKEKKDE